jgi:large subunit ribosomal protein L24
MSSKVHKMKIRKGDQVVVLTGKDKGKKGVVKIALPKSNKVVIEDVAVAKRHTKPTRSMQQGGIIDKPMPIDVSNVAIVSPADGKATKIGYRIGSDGVKVRVCRRSGVDLP